MSGRDRRQLKATLEAHRNAPAPEAPPVRRPAGNPRLDEARPATPPEGRPLTVEFVALRLQEAVIRREGRDALDRDVTQGCVRTARLLLEESRRG